jgi:hypothetical protein
MVCPVLGTGVDAGGGTGRKGRSALVQNDTRPQTTKGAQAAQGNALRQCEAPRVLQQARSEESQVDLCQKQLLREDLIIEELGKSMVGIQLKSHQCAQIRELHALLVTMNCKGVITLVRAQDPTFNCLLGFAEIHVHDILCFNQAVRLMVQESRCQCWFFNQMQGPWQPTKQVHEALRRVGVKAMRGTRGPPHSDPGLVDLMYQIYKYDRQFMSIPQNSRKWPQAPDPRMPIVYQQVRIVYV